MINMERILLVLVRLLASVLETILMGYLIHVGWNLL